MSKTITCRGFTLQKPGRKPVLARIVYRRSGAEMIRCIHVVYPRYKVTKGLRGVIFPISPTEYHIFLSGSGANLREVLVHEVVHLVSHKFQKKGWASEDRAEASGKLVCEVTKWLRTKKSAGNV